MEEEQAEPLVEFPDEPNDGGNLGFSAGTDVQRVGALGYYSWGSTGNSGRLSLGSADTRTCFLQGITGELQSVAGQDPARAGVYLDEVTNEWYVETRSGVSESNGDGGAGIMAHVTCIPNTTNRQQIVWVGNSSNGSNTAHSFAEDHGNTRCFLSSVSGTVGWGSPWSRAGLYPGSRNGQPTIELRGSLTTEQDGTSGGSASAYCVDISFQTESDWSASGPTTQGNIASVWPLTNTTAGVTCGISRLQGNYASLSSGSIWNDGVQIFPVATPGGGERWNMAIFRNKRAYGTCYRNWTFTPGHHWP